MDLHTDHPAVITGLYVRLLPHSRDPCSSDTNGSRVGYVGWPTRLVVISLLT